MEPEKKKNHVFYWGFLWREDQQPVPKLLPELTKHHIVSVKAGGFYFIALTAEGQVWGWGVPKHCRFGINSNDDVKVPTLLPLKIKIIKIAAGNWHSLLIDNEYQIHGCGHNKYGAVGISGFHNIN
jgi:alpha-tubulin suppressor-like RCC1 family protein